MGEKKTQIAVRITPSEHKQLLVIADAESRTLNGEISYLIKKRIAEYRESNPELQFDILKK